MTANKRITYIDEPLLCFGYNQTIEYTKDGLTLFGPLDSDQNPPPMRVGVLGSPRGVALYKKWVRSVNGYIPGAKENDCQHRAFPGYEAIFGAIWPETPVCELEIPHDDIVGTIQIEDKHQAIYNTVTLFEERVRRYIAEEEDKVDFWFVVIPEEVYRYGRPQVRVPKNISSPAPEKMNAALARKLEQTPSLFEEDNEIAEIYKYERNFHNQLKARLLDTKEVLQVVRETTLSPEEFVTESGKQIRSLQDPATVAWNLCTTAFFKSSGRPWKLAEVRGGVCYVGIVFKIDETSRDPSNACCGAQMFLDSGDGLVFKGAVGPWYSEQTGQFHIPYKEAKDLAGMVIRAYQKKHGFPPKELFIHGKTRIDEEEWSGFQAGVPEETNVVSIQIQDERQFKLYSAGDFCVPRGLAFLVSKRKGYLWTKGYIEGLQTYPGREVPKPLSIQITYGEADLLQVMKDIIGLTKVNFNACIYADGEPVTLRFADLVGEILTSIPKSHDVPPLPFKHYI